MPDALSSVSLPTHPWLSRVWSTASGAIVADAAPAIDPLTVFRHAASRPHVLFLDSALTDAAPSTGPVTSPRLGRWSFVAADPIHSIVVEPGSTVVDIHDAFARARSILADLASTTIPGLPPFQGGLAGLLSYDCGLIQLGLAPPRADMPVLPLISLHLYDVVFAYDHDRTQGWFISQGVPARGSESRRRRACERLTD